jgi:hypothetical protein
MILELPSILRQLKKAGIPVCYKIFTFLPFAFEKRKETAKWIAAALCVCARRNDTIGGVKAKPSVSLPKPKVSFPRRRESLLPLPLN